MSDREMWTHWLKTHDAVSGVKINTRPSTNKYQAHAVRVDGILFDSQREAARYQELKLRQLAGEISHLEIHPGFALIVPQLSGDELPVAVFHTVGMFHADFKYRDHRTKAWVVEDVKSQPTKTEAYKLRKKIVEAVHGITITEIA